MAYQVDSIAYLQHIYQIKLTMTMSRCSLLLGFLLLSLNLATAQQLDPCWSNDVVSTHHSGMPNEDKPDCPFTSTLQGAPQFAFSWPTFSSPNGGNGIIYAIATDGAGNWYVGGNFTLVNSSPSVSAHYIARFHAPTNTWSALGSGNGLNGEVRSIAILGNSLFVGGEFTQADAGSASPVSVSNTFQHTGLAVVLQGLVRPRLRGTELEFWRNSEEARTDRPSQQLRSLNGEWRLMRYFLLTHLCGISHRIWCTLSTICSDAA